MLQDSEIQKMNTSRFIKYSSLIGLLLGLIFPPLVHGDQAIKPDITYMLLIPAELHYPSTEKACLLLEGDLQRWDFTVTATLEVRGQSIKLCQIRPISGFVCCDFQVPPPNEGTSEVAKVRIVSHGEVTFEESKDVLIQRIVPGVVIQTDKPSYNPSDTVKFRIVTLDENFLCAKTKYNIVQIMDPHSNYISQWLGVGTTMCIAEFVLHLSSDPILGTYTIKVENGLAFKTFVVEEIVLPRFEVTIEKPSIIYVTDPTFPLRVCGRYTYGKGVQGTLKVVLCRETNRVYHGKDMICITINGKTDATGCFQTAVDGTLLHLKDPNYRYFSVVITADLVEGGTGVALSASQTVPVSFAVGTLTFDDMDIYYKRRYPYTITLVAQGRDGAPLQLIRVSLEVSFEDKKVHAFGITDTKGRAPFSLDTLKWHGQVEIRGYVNDTAAIGGTSGGEIPDVIEYVMPYYSKAVSYLRIHPHYDTIPCGQKVNIRVEYDISPKDVEEDWEIIKFYYFVIGKDGIMQNGEAIIITHKKPIFHGFQTVQITFTPNFGPAPKLLGFVLLKDKTVTADRLLFSVERCLPNQASLKFSLTEANPKTHLSLTVGSSVGSLCAVRAVDKSVQINNLDKELTLESVFALFPDSVRGGYPASVQEGTNYFCRWSSKMKPSFPFNPPEENDYVDVSYLFEVVGAKILTNVQIMRPKKNPVPCLMLKEPVMETAGPPPKSSVPASNNVRKWFPDTWLWSLVPIGQSGQSIMKVTAPDTITQFNARAFCMGYIGFGLSPQVSLTVFQPFFVDVALPYSIIQGETLVLKATVFNYLNHCLKVQITLLNSVDFSVKDCKVCMSSSCICHNQAVTFSWNITANRIGSVTITVRAEAVASNDHCRGKKPYVPPTGNLDILQRQLLVKPPGILREVTENMYLCPNASHSSIEKSFSLRLPKAWVEKSEHAYVSVTGDILGATLNNLDNLIQMPYGCGEQNMLTMAPIVYVLQYLQATGQLGAAEKQKAIGYLQSGYQRELNYKHNDGSYSAFGMSDAQGSTWLTAFVLKTFHHAKAYIFIDNAVLAQAVAWLALQQRADGCFISRGSVIHTTMKGGVEDELSLSAYVTAALLEQGTPVTEAVMVHALACLRNGSHHSTNPYTMALLAYTFALANDAVNKQILLHKLLLLAVSSGGDLHWTYNLQSSSVSASVELTAYVLLVLTTAPTVPANDILTASHIVSWLVKQQNSYGGFSSTQDTVVAIQALAKYTRITFGSEGAVSVTVSSNHAAVAQFKVDKTNRLLLQKANLPKIPGDYILVVTGSGCVFIQIDLKYNVLLLPPPSAFNIVANIVDCDQKSGIFTLSISVRYIGKRKVTNMVLIEVEMLSGFQLYGAVESQFPNSPLVKKVNFQKETLIIYIEQLDHTTHNYHIKIQQVVTVIDLKPAHVKVYDYYLPEENAVTTYSPCH